MRKIIFQWTILPWFKWVAFIFYKRKYLIGRHFETPSLQGWVWVISGIWKQKILGFNRYLPFPCHPTARIYNYKNIIFDVDNLDNFQSPGIYFDCANKSIYLGKGTYIAPNVGLITANHQFDNLDIHQEGEDIIIGKHCWIGMNAVILPGVILGDHTIVGAGAVVTKSFPAGNCVLGGVPAKIIKMLPSKKINS
jgi:acetyltransferase-like isoleucine patch superfamily enzyme